MLSTDSTQTKTTKMKCGYCSKKLGLIPFVCRCGGSFCAAHRLDIDHTCSFDYQKENRKLLSTTLEKVVGRKVDVL
jgi:predicted nucleic acid binding AN1-type Zn finger protein